MAELSGAQQRLLARLRCVQRWTAVTGSLLALAGALYAGWGLYCFDPRAEPGLDPGFDRPVAGLSLLYAPHYRSILKIRPETFTEEVLMETITRGIHFHAAFLTLLLRLFLGTLATLGGLIMLTVYVERRRLLAVIERLRA
jgi:hypothetical protein